MTIHIPPETIEAFRKASGINAFAGDVAAGLQAALAAWPGTGMAREGIASGSWSADSGKGIEEPEDFPVLIIRTEEPRK